ncbi:MAG: hypothetical protein R3F17_01720 [Planctomycetota bacterium]
MSALLCSVGSAVGQNGDSCSNATPITGLPSLTWNTANYHHNPLNPGGPCEISLGFDDRYFFWTAPAGGNYQFDTLGATWNTELSIYDGSDCSAACLAFDDGILGMFSAIQIENVQAGHVYLIRSAVQDDPLPPYGGLRIREVEPGCLFSEDDALENPGRYDDQVPIGNGTYSNLKLRYRDLDSFLVCVGAGSTLQVDAFFSHAQGNIELFAYQRIPSGPGFSEQPVAFGSSTTDNETMAWTNNTGFDRDVRVIAAHHLGPDHCVDYTLQIAGAGGCGFVAGPFCDPMDPNSTGQPTLLGATQVAGSGSGLHLEITQGPPTQFGYLVVGTGISDPGLPISGGRFCLALDAGNQYGRYNWAGTPMNSIGIFNAAGIFQNLVGTSAIGTGFDVPIDIPILGLDNPFIGLVASSAWHFQTWHRESNGGSNFSNGLTVQF